MSGHVYTTYNAAMATTSATAKVSTGTSLKTMLQLATPATRGIWILSWGFSVDAPPAAAGTGVVELIQTDVAATVTAHSASGVQPADPDAPASLLTLGVAATGFTGTAEGTTTASRLFDFTDVAGVSNGAWPTKYSYNFLLDDGELPRVDVSSFLRVRVLFSAAVSMNCWVKFRE